MPATKNQVKAAIEIAFLVSDLIRALGEVPSGELYARLMPSEISLDMYNGIINLLKSGKMIRESDHLITWIGSAEEKQ